MNKLIIGGREFSSRLFVGTGKFSSNELMEKAIEASGSEMITVAMKRINMTQEATDDMLTSTAIEYNFYLTHREYAMPRRPYLRLNFPENVSGPISLNSKSTPIPNISYPILWKP